VSISELEAEIFGAPRMNGNDYFEPDYPMTDSEAQQYEPAPGLPGEPGQPDLSPLTIGTMAKIHRALRPVVIDGVLRVGETMNIIAASKTGKTWSRDDLAISMALGLPWMGLYQCHPAPVLILDNELHAESLTYRLLRVAEGRGVTLANIADKIHVQSLRGKLMDLFALRSYLKQFKPGQFGAIIIDAFYRTLPVDTDENDNGAMANLYNTIDQYADELQTSFVLIHHASKGSQAGKAITDIGSGAGSMSRAADTHLVMLHHEEPGAIVINAACRSFPPLEPSCFRFVYPNWMAAPDLDATKIKQARSRASKPKEPKPEKPKWTVEKFVEMFGKAEPQGKELIEVAAALENLSNRETTRLLKASIASGKLHIWSTNNPKDPQRYSTEQQPLIECAPPIQPAKAKQPVGRPRHREKAGAKA
jgi:hypothetical protein